MADSFRISFCNPGGELDSRTASTPEEAARKAAEMILECGQLHDGDRITITGPQES